MVLRTEFKEIFQSFHPSLNEKALNEFYNDLVYLTMSEGEKNLQQNIKDFLSSQNISEDYESSAILLRRIKGEEKNESFDCAREENISTGFENIDSALFGGIKRRHIISVTGEMASGKTTYSISMAVAALNQGHKVLHISASESSESVVLKYVCNLASVNQSNLIKQNFTEAEVKRIDAIKEELNDNLKVLSITSGEQLIQSVRRIREEGFNFDMIIIDSITEFYDDTVEAEGVLGVRARYLHKFMRVLQTMSVEYDCVVLTTTNQRRPSYHGPYHGRTSPEVSEALSYMPSLIFSLQKEGQDEVRIKIIKNKWGPPNIFYKAKVWWEKFRFKDIVSYD